MVVATAGSALTASVDAHVLVGCFGERHSDTLHAFVHPHHRSPVGSHLGSQCRSCHQPCPRVAVVVAAGAVVVVHPWQAFHALRLCCHIFNAGGQPVVHVGEEVVALVPSHLGQVDGQAERHGRVARVAAALVHLAQLPVGTRFQFAVGSRHHQVAQKLRQSVVLDGHLGARVAIRAHLVVFEVAHALIVDEHVVAEHTDGHHAEGVAQAPVRPVVARCLPPFALVFPRAVAVAQETDGLRIPQPEHPLAKLLEVFAGPALVVAHELSGLGKLVAVESHGQTLVAVARNLLGGACPCHEDAHGGLCAGLVVLYLPSQRVLISHRRAARCVDVVFARAATAHDGLHGISLHARLCVGSLAQHVVGSHDALVACVQLGTHSVEVGLRVQSARVSEASVGRVLCAGGKQKGCQQ